MEANIPTTEGTSSAKRKKSGGGKSKRPKSGSSASRRRWVDGFASAAQGVYVPVAPNAELSTRKFCYPSSNLGEGQNVVNFTVRAGKNEFIRWVLAVHVNKRNKSLNVVLLVLVFKMIHSFLWLNSAREMLATLKEQEAGRGWRGF